MEKVELKNEEMELIELEYTKQLKVKLKEKF